MVRNIKGETIVETLIAILIVAVCFIMLQTSIVTAAKINKSASEENTPYNRDIASEDNTCIITIGSNIVNNVKCYITKDGEYYYYE